MSYHWKFKINVLLRLLRKQKKNLSDEQRQTEETINAEIQEDSNNIVNPQHDAQTDVEGCVTFRPLPFRPVPFRPCRSHSGFGLKAR